MDLIQIFNISHNIPNGAKKEKQYPGSALKTSMKSVNGVCFQDKDMLYKEITVC